MIGPSLVEARCRLNTIEHAKKSLLYDNLCMSKRSENHVLPYEVTQGLKTLGSHLSRARRARGDTQAIAGERCGLHAQTVARIEQGDTGVSAGNLFALMHVYGMGARLFELARTDEATEILYRHHLPKRGRS